MTEATPCPACGGPMLSDWPYPYCSKPCNRRAHVRAKIPASRAEARGARVLEVFDPVLVFGKRRVEARLSRSA